MSELKAYQVICTDDIDRNEITENFSAPDFLAYDADEADKVIAELEESHKKEVEQLLMDIIELKKRIFDGDKDFEMANHQNERLLKIVRHQKYKRCLAMTEEWRSYAAFCGIQSSWHNNRGFGKTAEKWTWKECHAWRCVKRWLELAEKFKEAK